MEPLHLTEEGALPGVTQEDGTSVLPGLMPFSAGHLAFLGLPRSAPGQGTGECEGGLSPAPT